jgi:hypothetical protein
VGVIHGIISHFHRGLGRISKDNDWRIKTRT